MTRGRGRRPGRRSCGAVLAVFVLLVVGAGQAGAREPVDVLSRSVERTGLLEYELAVDVEPGGGIVPGEDDHGQVVPGLRQRYDVAAAVALEYWVSERLSLRAAGTAGAWAVRRGVPGEAPPPWQWGAGAGHGQLGIGWRWAPGTAWDPRLDVAMLAGTSGRMEAHVSVRRVRDPVVLTGALGFITDAPTAGDGFRVVASAKAAFVANDKVSFVAGVSHLVPAGTLEVPATMLSAGVHYVVDEARDTGIGVETTLAFRGERVDVGLRLSWSGRHGP